jgi:hypothetical protein
MSKLKNPPPKRVRLTKNLGYETRKFLNHLEFLFTMGRSGFDFDETKRQMWDDLCALRAHWNTWWDQEKERRHGKAGKR